MVSLDETSLNPQERLLLEHFAGELRSQSANPLHAVWLFGSRARGENPSAPPLRDVVRGEGRLSERDVTAKTHRGTWHESCDACA